MSAPAFMFSGGLVVLALFVLLIIAAPLLPQDEIPTTPPQSLGEVLV